MRARGGADRRIHVMQTVLGMNFGGMERVIIDLYRHVDPERFRFSVCCLSLRGPLGDEVEADGVPLIVCQNQRKIAKYLRGIEFGRILKEHRVDVLHTHNTTAFIDGVIGARIAGTPVVVHTDHCKNYPIEKRWMVAENVASRFVDKVIAVSHHTRGELIEYENIAPDKIEVIHNGINPRPSANLSLDALRQELGLRADRPVIGTIGRLVPQKALDLMLAAVPKLVAAQPDVQVVIVGGGALEEELKAQATALGIRDHVVFTGWRLDAVDLLGLFDCFVQTSVFEGLPMVLLEAMALGKPIVASAVGGVAEAVEDGVTGITLKTRDANELSDALIRLVSRPDLARQMGAAGRASYERQFTAEAMASRYAALYDRFLEGRKVQAA